MSSSVALYTISSSFKHCLSESENKFLFKSCCLFVNNDMKTRTCKADKKEMAKCVRIKSDDVIHLLLERWWKEKMMKGEVYSEWNVQILWSNVRWNCMKVIICGADFRRISTSFLISFLKIKVNSWKKIIKFMLVFWKH